MKKLLVTIASLLAFVAMPSHAITIDFDDLTPGTIVGGSYAGVTFFNATVGGGGTLPGGSPPNTIFSTSGFTTPGPADAIEATFDGLASSVTLTGLDVGAAGFQLLAYNADDLLIDSASFIGTGTGPGSADLTVMGAIKWVAFSQVTPCCGDGILFDNFNYTPSGVPAPAGIAILGLGLLGLGYRRRNA